MMSQEGPAFGLSSFCLFRKPSGDLKQLFPRCCESDVSGTLEMHPTVFFKLFF